jgi:hypothetical protein
MEELAHMGGAAGRDEGSVPLCRQTWHPFRKKNLLFFIGPAHSKEKHQLAIKSAQGRGCQEHFFKNYEQRF